MMIPWASPARNTAVSPLPSLEPTPAWPVERLAVEISIDPEGGMVFIDGNLMLTCQGVAPGQTFVWRSVPNSRTSSHSGSAESSQAFH